MSLPININELLNGRTVEWDRIEFRQGWNPDKILRTISAFANDFNNWGGGYIILGIEEKNGLPVLPPKGINLNEIDKIQKELNNICRKILPNYFPIIEPVNFRGKQILVLWCYGGSNRPYKAPEKLGKDSRYFYYIRRFSSTVQASYSEEKELFSLAERIPFDDRINRKATLIDLDIAKIKIYLDKIESGLGEEITNLTIAELARRMNIVEGPDENLIPKNIGLLMFAKNTGKYFPYAKIEVVSFKDDSGTEYTEKLFEGSISEQLTGALSYLKNSLIVEKIKKRKDIPEADRFFNYPYEALEEALCNAVYHKGYDDDSPIEVRIFPNKLDIINFPGPLPPLTNNKLKKYNFDVRKYRNRRIGEFLKELHLAEGRGTGIPTILKSLKNNNSPKPIFETDENRTYFKTTIKIHPYFIEEISQKSSSYKKIVNRIPSWDQVGTKLGLSPIDTRNILLRCKYGENVSSLMKFFNLKHRTKFRNTYLMPLIIDEYLQMTIPDKPNSPKQKYITTEKGNELLKSINNITNSK